MFHCILGIRFEFPIIDGERNAFHSFLKCSIKTKTKTPCELKINPRALKNDEEREEGY